MLDPPERELSGEYTESPERWTLQRIRRGRVARERGRAGRQARKGAVPPRKGEVVGDAESLRWASTVEEADIETRTAAGAAILMITTSVSGFGSFS